jgi:hypothetical protein
MASTFLELYSDFQDEVKAYTEKLDVTELSFMRRLSKGIQRFQSETEYVEFRDILNRHPDGFYRLPYEYKRIVKIEALGDERIQFEMGSFLQLNDSIERNNSGFIEKRDNVEINRRYSGERTIEYGLHGREFFFDTRLPANMRLRIFYIPDLSPISIGSALWTQPDDLTVTPNIFRNWFPTDQLITDPVTTMQVSRLLYMMGNTRLLSPMGEYEDAILNHAIASYIRSKGSINYQVFERNFNEGVKTAIINKPEPFRNGVADYNYSVWS